MTRRGERDIVFVERESASPLWWLVVGGAVGAGIALLFAPQAGTKTRRAVAGRLQKLRDSAEEVLDEFREAADDAGAEPEASTDDEALDEEEAEGDIEELAEADEPVVIKPRGEARVQLEKRLAAARTRRQRALAEEDEEPVA